MAYEYRQWKPRRSRSGWGVALVAALILCLLAACFAVGVVGYVYHNGLRVQLHGESTLNQEYNEPYIDPGADYALSGFLPRQDTVKMTVTGSVNTKKLGAYELTYLAEYDLDLFFFTLTCRAADTRTVVVRDTKAPQIQLLTDPDYFTLPGGTYEEEGFVAGDNHDGDLTGAVVRTQTRDQVIYRVTDSSGNTAEVIRPIEYSDPIAPELTLLGAPHIMLQVETPYEEPGYTALDNCDGDIGQRVEITGQVDTTKEGTYVLEYAVEDSYGNRVTANRTVYVSKMPPVPGVPHTQYETPLPSNGKVIYLTFDDGPSSHTTRLLDILDKYGVKATFFVVYAGNQTALKRMVESGHTVAIHSATHNYEQIYSSTEAFFADLYGMQEIIYQNTGVRTTLMRFPGGSSNTISRKYSPGIMTRLTQAVQDAGFQYFDWNVLSGDAGETTKTDDVIDFVIAGVQQHRVSVVLQHDIHYFSVAAVEKILRWGKQNGYQFLALRENSPACHQDVLN